MNYQSRHLLTRLDAHLAAPLNRQRKRAVAKLFRLAKNQGLLKPEIVEGWKHVTQLVKEMAELEATASAKADAVALIKASAAEARAEAGVA